MRNLYLVTEGLSNSLLLEDGVGWVLSQAIQACLQTSDDSDCFVDGFRYSDASVVSHYFEHITDSPVLCGVIAWLFI